MKKKVSAREFLHGFARVHESLQPGESITITRHGKPLGKFIKELQVRKIKLPDFEKRACAHGYSLKTGSEVLRRVLRDETLS